MSNILILAWTYLSTKFIYANKITQNNQIVRSSRKAYCFASLSVLAYLYCSTLYLVVNWYYALLRTRTYDINAWLPSAITSWKQYLEIESYRLLWLVGLPDAALCRPTTILQYRYRLFDRLLSDKTHLCVLKLFIWQWVLYKYILAGSYTVSFEHASSDCRYYYRNSVYLYLFVRPSVRTPFISQWIMSKWFQEHNAFRHVVQLIGV